MQTTQHVPYNSDETTANSIPEAAGSNPDRQKRSLPLGFCGVEWQE
jgi:hypothetical protein